MVWYSIVQSQYRFALSLGHGLKLQAVCLVDEAVLVILMREYVYAWCDVGRHQSEPCRLL